MHTVTELSGKALTDTRQPSICDTQQDHATLHFPLNRFKMACLSG